MTSVPSTSDAQSNDNSSSQSNANSVTPDFDLFLKLLTTQISNQDPLNPTDTSQFTQQLVEYAQVEQETDQNKTLSSILTNLYSQGISQASSFIGREARFDTDTAGLQGSSPATWTYASQTKPTSLVATIKDADGKVVRTVTLDPTSDGRFSWDGKKDDGSQAPDGAYTLSLDAKDAKGADVTMVINSVGIVKDVVTDGQEVLLGVNGLRFSLKGMVSVSNPEPANT